jgi:phospholipid/cholesterol/gamma-HCH transport system ATP-binding protein
MEKEKSTKPEIKIENLSIAFGTKKVLNDFNLEIKKGENLVILGKSGCGKSVVIKCIIGLLIPDKGRIEVLGEKILESNTEELNKIRKRIGFLFQSGALYDSMNVKQNLLFPLRMNKEMELSEKEKLVKEILEKVGLSDTINKMPTELSGGMRKRLGLARSLMLKPEIMLYDEPTTGLDPITAKEISNLILTIQKEQGTSSIIITHDMNCAKITSNRIVILDQGKISTEGNFKELEQSKIEEVKGFFEN